MDESGIVAGAMKLTFYLIVCLIGYIALPKFFCTIIVWVSCTSYLFLEQANNHHIWKTTPSHVRLKIPICTQKNTKNNFLDIMHKATTF